jgi:hypothetical protein
MKLNNESINIINLSLGTMQRLWRFKLERVRQVGDLWTVRFGLKTKQQGSTRFSTQDLSNGVYFWKIKTSKGELYKGKTIILH